MMKVTLQQVEMMFAEMSGIYLNQLPNNINQINAMINIYFNRLKGFDSNLVKNNFDKHLNSSSFFPTIADLCKADEEKDLLQKSLIESQKYISMIDEEEKNIKPKSEEDLQKIKDLKEKMNKLQRDGRKRYDERIAKLFEQ